MIFSNRPRVKSIRDKQSERDSILPLEFSEGCLDTIVTYRVGCAFYYNRLIKLRTTFTANITSLVKVPGKQGNTVCMNVSPFAARKRETKNVSELFQKHPVSATNVFCTREQGSVAETFYAMLARLRGA